jgi:hypothetical protein
MAPNRRSARDTGLRRVSLTTRWIAAGAAVLTGAITVWEARSVHSSAASTPTVVRQPSTAAGSGSASPGSSSSGSSTPAPSPTDPAYSDPGYSDPGYSDPGYSSNDLQAPQYAPSPSDQQPLASSGGS